MEASPPQPPKNPPTDEQPGASAPSGEQGKRPGPQTAEQQGLATHSTDPHERIDGLRAWLAQVDRKLGVRTYAFAAASVLALAAAAVAIVFALQLQEDSATNKDLDDLQSQLGTVSEEATQAAEEDVESLSDRLDSLESEVASLQDDQSTTNDELQVVQDDIEDLRSDISNIDTSSTDSSSDAEGDSGGLDSP